MSPVDHRDKVGVRVPLGVEALRGHGPECACRPCDNGGARRLCEQVNDAKDSQR